MMTMDAHTTIHDAATIALQRYHQHREQGWTPLAARTLALTSARLDYRDSQTLES